MLSCANTSVLYLVSWGQFHQHFKHSFLACRSQKCKDIDDLTVFFALLVSAHTKALCKHVGEVNTWSPHSRSETYRFPSLFRVVALKSANTLSLLAVFPCFLVETYNKEGHQLSRYHLCKKTRTQIYQTFFLF